MIKIKDLAARLKTDGEEIDPLLAMTPPSPTCDPEDPAYRARLRKLRIGLAAAVVIGAMGVVEYAGRDGADIDRLSEVVHHGTTDQLPPISDLPERYDSGAIQQP